MPLSKSRRSTSFFLLARLGGGVRFLFALRPDRPTQRGFERRSRLCRGRFLITALPGGRGARLLFLPGKRCFDLTREPLLLSELRRAARFFRLVSFHARRQLFSLRPGRRTLLYELPLPKLRGSSLCLLLISPGRGA
ncbi:MAG TPA: hypothetical protein VJV74_10150 [Terriglobia bacterium]|nr:hypothetical protein [Terriglobia bacterium]